MPSVLIQVPDLKILEESETPPSADLMWLPRQAAASSEQGPHFPENPWTKVMRHHVLLPRLDPSRADSKGWSPSVLW